MCSTGLFFARKIERNLVPSLEAFVTSRKLPVAAVLLFLLMTISATAQVPLVHQGLIPASVAPGSATFTLTVYGAGFTSSAVVNWNGSPRLTEVLSASELKATINASDVAKGQTAFITVTNPGAGGGKSNVVFFPVTVPSSSIGIAFSQAVVPNPGEGIVVGDFNGDEKLDLAWADSNRYLWASLGNGNGTFQAPVESNFQFGPVATGDFNNDGKLDLVGLYNGAIGVALGNGDGTFTFKWSTNMASTYGLATVADFNRDGKLDLYVPGAYPSGDGFAIFLGNGDGTFTEAATYGPNIVFAGAAAGDFNGDGKVDLSAVGYTNGPELYIYQGDGDGTFQGIGTADYSGYGQVFAADMNNDGILDLMTDWVSILLGHGDGTFTMTYSNDTYYGIGGIGDLNGDGNLDIAGGSWPLAILPGAGNGQFLSAFTFYPSSINKSGAATGIGDFNNDGHLDIVYDPYIAFQIPVSLEPNSLFFVPQNVGTTSAPQTVPFVNVGWGPITINKISMGGTNAASFAQSNNCPTVLAANATCTISVTFTPRKGGGLTGSLIVSYKGSGTPQVVSLSGTGIVPPTVSLKPATLNFGVVVLGKSSGAETATLTNTGNQAVTISGIATSGAFTQTNNCPASLPVAGNCQIQVIFTPTAIGISKGSLTVTDDAANSPQTIALGGAGTIITLSPVGINFGDQKVGTTSAAASVTMSNVGTTAVTIGSVSLTGTNPGDFDQTNNCGKSLGAHTSCTIQVTFTPTATGSRSASLTVSDNGGGSPQKVSLTGTGT